MKENSCTRQVLEDLAQELGITLEELNKRLESPSVNDDECFSAKEFYRWYFNKLPSSRCLHLKNCLTCRVLGEYLKCQPPSPPPTVWQRIFGWIGRISGRS